MPPVAIIYFTAITLLTVVVTAYDKAAAKKYPRNRVPEKVLFALALLGGAVGEYVTMKAIRHKTKHKRFMLGLPLIIALQLAAVLSLRYFI